MRQNNTVRGLLAESINEIRENGFRSFSQRASKFVYYNVYLRLRDYFPRNQSGQQIRNGVRVAHDDARLLDTVIGRPFYEEGEIEYIKQYIHRGDTVVDIGGGIGVSTVWCARKAGRWGKVHVFEASETRINQIKRTLELNSVDADLRISHALVGEKAGEVRFNEGADAGLVSPEELPDCDVLNMDCEGAELTILRGMEINPRVVLVETHSEFDSPGSEVADVLRARGYEIVDIKGDLGGLAQIAAVRS